MPLIEPYKDQQVAIDKFQDVTAAFIADEMGVGKSVTAIGRDFQLRKDNPEYELAPTLIVSEKIGLAVQYYHLKAMGVDEKDIIVIDPANRAPFELALGDLREDLFRKRNPKYLYYVLHWHAIPLITDSLLATPHPITWFHIIADEFQLIKNPKALRTRYFKRVKGVFKTGCTGTPADDKPQDIWSLLNWLYPRDKRFSSFGRWGERYLEYEDKVRHDWYIDKRTRQRKFRETGYREITGVKNIEELHREIEPFYIRRTLLEIEPDMPEKIYVQPPITVKMTPKQRRMYDQMKKKSMARIGDIDDGGFVLTAPAVVAVVTRLQQICLGTIVPIWEAEEGVPDEEVDWDHPRIMIEKPSPKLDAVMDLITTHGEEPFVIFTQFRGMADLVEAECQGRGISVVKIHGGVTSARKREELVTRFQAGMANVFVGTIACAGTSITLTRAHHAIFVDYGWSPSKNAQAAARLWRRTQKNAVRIYSIEMENSIDQVRAEKIRTKADLVDAISNPARYA